MQDERQCEGGDGCEGPAASYRVTDHEGDVHAPVFYCVDLQTAVRYLAGHALHRDDRDHNRFLIGMYLHDAHRYPAGRVDAIIAHALLQRANDNWRGSAGYTADDCLAYYRERVAESDRRAAERQQRAVGV